MTHDQNSRRTGLPTTVSPDPRSKLLYRLAGMIALMGVGLIAADIYFYARTSAWQFIASGSALVGGVLLAWIASLLVRRNQVELSARLLAIELGLAFIVHELLLRGATVVFIIGGLVVLAVYFRLLWPHGLQTPFSRRWPAWLLLYAAAIPLLNRLDVLQRFPIIQLPTLQIVPALVVGSALVLFGAMALISLRIGSIRTRLLLTFSALALLPALATGGITTALGVRTVRQAAHSQLSSILQMRQQQINTWVESLQQNLDIELSVEKRNPVFDTLFTTDRSSPEYQAANANLLKQFQTSTQNHGVFASLFVADRQGNILVSTDDWLYSQSLINEFFFRSALLSPYTGAPYFSPQLKETTMYAARPLQDASGKLLGIIGGRVNLETLRKITGEWTGFGETGHVYLVAANYALLTPTRFNDLADKQQYLVDTITLMKAIDERQTGVSEYEDRREQRKVGAYLWVPQLQATLVAERDYSETFQPLISSILFSTLAALGAILFAMVGASFVTRSIANPLIGLTNTAEAIAAGNFDLEADTGPKDEIGVLARAFNAVTARVRQLIATLEQRVADRTADLERRNEYFQAASEVSRATASITNSNQLIRQVVDQIQYYFKLYYVGLFIVDESGQWAQLRAGTGLAGQAMLSRGHRLQIGAEGASHSMIGWCITNNRARVAQEAIEEAIRLRNPELPDTRSEAALPLRSRGRVLGAITVQSSQSNAFDDQTLSVLQTMADQVAIALDNARLFSESEKSLNTVRRLYGEQALRSWQSWARRSQVVGYRRDPHGLIPLSGQDTSYQPVALNPGSDIPPGQMGDSSEPRGRQLNIPLLLHNHPLGFIQAVKPEGSGAWSKGEIELIQALTDQLSQALENARLYQDIQNRADRDRLTSQLTARLRETLDIDTVLRTAAQQVRTSLGLPEVTVRLVPGKKPVRPRPNDPDNGSQDTAAPARGFGDHPVQDNTAHPKHKRGRNGDKG